MHSAVRRSSTAVAFVIATLAPAGAHAQQGSPGPRWLGLLGCWSIAQSGTAKDSQRDGRLVCITPTSDPNVAEISAIADGKVMSKDRVDASGRAYPMTVDNCTGTQRANWSADQRRLFLKSTITCAGVTKDMSALLALTLGGEWIDVRRVWSGHPDSADVNVARYHDVGVTSGVPADIANRLRDYGMSIETGRIAASVPVAAPAIIEASKLADSTIVAAWLSESGQRFALDSREWRELADAGVSAQVRDAMDETVNPRQESNGHYVDEHRRWAQQSSAQWNQGTGLRKIFATTSDALVFYDPWGYGVGYGRWVYGTRYEYGYLQPMGFGFGDVIGLDGAIGYLFGYRKPAAGNIRPNVLVLKDEVTGDGKASSPPGSDPKGDDQNAKKAASAPVGRGGSSTTSSGSAPAATQAPKAPSSGGTAVTRPF
ncbi:MAG: hypothetical protein ABJE47_17410 [bacterium]